MAEGLNRVLLLGNIVADPELKSTQGGQTVLKLRLATNERYLDSNKAWQERTEYHNVSVWGKRGEALHRLLTKGSGVFVEGSLRTSSYEKDGQKIYRTEIVASNVLFAGSAKGAAKGPPADDYDYEQGAPPARTQASKQGGAPRPAPQRQAAPPADDFDDYNDPGDDNIPF